ITSSKQCTEAIYKRLQCWPVTDLSYNKNKSLSVDKNARRAALALCPENSLGRDLAVLKQEHSAVYKIITAYCNTIDEKIGRSPDGRLRARINPIGTETGRFSCSSPNLQAQPRDRKDLPSIRSCFVAPPGRMLVVRDWSQLEIRVMAHFTRDPAILKIVL